MTAYVLVHGPEGLHDRLVIYKSPSRALAWIASVKQTPRNGSGYVFETDDDLRFNGFRGKKALDVYNLLTYSTATKPIEWAEFQKALEARAKEIPLETPEAVTVHEKPNLADTVPLSPAAEPKKRGRKPKEVVLGMFEPVRRNSTLGKIAAAATAHDGVTMTEVLAATGLDEEKLVSVLRRARVTHGIDHAFTVGDGDSIVTIIIPEGRELFKETKTPTQRTGTETSGERKPNRRTSEVTEAARAGVKPTKPIVTSETNKHRQKHFDRLEELVNEGEWDKVRAFNMTGVDTYCKMINRYRDDLLVWHDAVAEKSQSEERELAAA